MGGGTRLRTIAILGPLGAAAVIAACAEDPAPSDVAIEPPGRVTPEAGKDATSPTDSAADAGGCDLGAPFGAPELLPFSAAEDEQGAWVTENGVFFARTFAGVGGAILFAKRESDGGFGEPKPVQIPNLGDITFPSLSSDGLVLFVRASSQVGGVGIYRATRGSVNDLVFGQPAALRADGGVVGDYAPSLGPDGLYYAQQVVRATSKDYDLRRAKLGATGEVVDDETLSSLNTTFNDAAAQVTADGLRVYFASDRLGVDAKGGFDVWTATRSAIGEPFGDAKLVGELSAKTFDIPVWVAPDGCTILVESDRDRTIDVQHGTDLYIAKKPAR